MRAQSIRSTDGRRPCRRRPVVTLLLLAVGLLATGVLPLVARADHVRPVPNDDPAAVVEAYAAAVNAGDLEGILALYANDAVHIALPTPDGSAGVCLGKEQFRLFYEQSVANRDRLAVVEDTLTVTGDRVTFVARLASDPWRKLGLESLEANVEAIVVDGRFTTHVVMLTPGSVRALLSALGTIPTPPAGTEPVSEPHHGPL